MTLAASRLGPVDAADLPDYPLGPEDDLNDAMRNAGHALRSRTRIPPWGTRRFLGAKRN
ncbi:hypothetical protein [Rhodovulum sp. BSW8]|uniref:hypothetical protein n=1 Tax=Rhodovulum sp. BSW8 TaxID=2259645 RepID=UPI0014025D9A|nr:hypothetical protein [Rhodovulum sp. BSW8]